jgi:transcriptional regulator with XRE-family HTH domain
VEPIYLEVGQRLRRARLAAGLTQAQLADRAELSRTSITNIELGRQRFTLDGLVRLAAGVGVDPAQLLPPGDGTRGRTLSRKLRGLDPEDQAAVEKVLLQAEATGRGVKGGRP